MQLLINAINNNDHDDEAMMEKKNLMMMTLRLRMERVEMKRKKAVRVGGWVELSVIKGEGGGVT